MEELKKENNNKKGNIVLLILAIVSILGIGFLLYKKLTYKEVVDLKATPSVNVTHIRKGNIEKTVSLMGNILPSDTYYVVTKVGGDISKIYVKNGDHVKKGDPICEIDASKEIEAAFIQYDAAKKSYERMEKLFNAGDISAQSFEQVKAQYDGAKLAYDTKIEYSTPVAVGDGVIENTDMTLNTSIKTEKVLCYITSKDAKEINFGVTERILHGINIGDIVKIEKNGSIYDGYISNIANLIDAQTGLFNIKAVITSENNFASGIMAKVTFVYDKRKNVNLLPNDMIYYENGNPYVYVVNTDNIINKKYITVGLENENYSEITSELDKNEKIVSTWNNDLAQGALVNIVKDEETFDILPDEFEKEIINDNNKNVVNEDVVNENVVSEDIDSEDVNETIIENNDVDFINTLKNMVIASDSEAK